MALKLSKALTDFKTHLVSASNKEPLGFLALAVIVLLDIFVLAVLFKGLEDQTAQLMSPDSYIPVICQEMIIHENWGEEELLDKLEDWRETNVAYYLRDDDGKPRTIHPDCRPLLEQLENILKNKEIKSALEKRRKYLVLKAGLEDQIEIANQDYQTVLLGRIASVKTTETPIDPVREKKNAAAWMQVRIDKVNTELRKNKDFVLLISMIREKQLKKDELAAKLRQLEFLYPLKGLALHALFLVPLLVAFFFWYVRSVARQAGIQTLLASHLLVVTAIPTLYKTIETVLDIIPEQIIRTIIEWLKSFKLIGIWYYLLISVSVLAAMFLIYFIQKKIFSQERLLQKRLARGECHACGRRISREDKSCPHCGKAQLVKCLDCGEETYQTGKYCRVCGKKA